MIQVSIIIINYNTFEITLSCIKSICKKVQSTSFEIILVDNGSSECSPDLFLKHVPQLVLIKSPVNLGFSKGNNLGIQAAKGDVILLLNSDMELINDAVSITYNFLSEHPEVAVVTAQLLYPDGRIQHNCQRFPRVGVKLFELLRLQKILPKKIGKKFLLGSFFDHQTVAFPDWVWGTYFMFKRELLQSLPKKKLSDDFFMYVEDMQWCLEFRKLGFEIAFEPEARVFHFMGKSAGRKSEMLEQNTMAFMKMYYSSMDRILISLFDKLLIR
jgi:GT2 family glycosyltransferase